MAADRAPREGISRAKQKVEGTRVRLGRPDNWEDRLPAVLQTSSPSTNRTATAGTRPRSKRAGTGHRLERAGAYDEARAAYEAAATKILSLPEQRYLHARAPRLRP